MLCHGMWLLSPGLELIGATFAGRPLSNGLMRVPGALDVLHPPTHVGHVAQNYRTRQAEVGWGPALRYFTLKYNCLEILIFFNTATKR